MFESNCRWDSFARDLSVCRNVDSVACSSLHRISTHLWTLFSSPDKTPMVQTSSTLLDAYVQDMNELFNSLVCESSSLIRYFDRNESSCLSHHESWIKVYNCRLSGCFASDISNAVTNICRNDNVGNKLIDSDFDRCISMKADHTHAVLSAWWCLVYLTLDI